jgi:hypothetical protein
MPSTFEKDPDAVLDYQFDWSDWLAEGDSISSYTIDEDTGITVDSSSNDADSVTVWLSGGTALENYVVRCEIVTSDGRTDERSMLLRVRER